MALRRLWTRRQRAAIWATAAITLLAGVVGYRFTERHPPSREPLAFHLRELGPEETGIHFTHRSADVAPFFENVRAFAQAVSAAAAAGDVDGDGWIDLYLLTAGRGSPNKLYRNVGNFHFVEISLPVIEDLNQDAFSTDALFADVNGDGYDDLLVVFGSHGPRLFLNTQAPGTPLGRTFVETTATAGLPAYMNAHAANFLDVDNDGDLDLVIAGYSTTRYAAEDVPGAPYFHHLKVPDSPNAGRVMPNNWGNATNGGEKHLLLNDGTGRFVEQDLRAWGFLPEHRFTFDIGTADLNRDGYTDLYFANDFGPDELYFNQGGRSFRPFIGRFPTDAGRDAFKGMNAEIADLDHDGFPEIYVTNIFHPFLPEGNLLWLNTPARGGGREFRNVSAELGVKDGGWGWGAKFVDLDLDGDLDIVATNGMISGNPKKDYWFRMSRLVGGNTKIISDSKNWPAFKDASLCGFQRSRVFVNDGHRFYDRAADAGITRTFDGRGVLVADFDRDGRPDVVVVPQEKAPFIARNVFVPTEAVPGPPGFIGLALAGDGRRVNRDAVGSQVAVRPATAGDPAAFRPQFFEVSAGNGFSAQSMYWVVAGLGRYSGPVDVEIRWTDGSVETRRLAPGGYYRVTYGGRPESVDRLAPVATGGR